MLLLELSYVAPVSSTGTVFVPWMPEVFLFFWGGGGTTCAVSQCCDQLETTRSSDLGRMAWHCMWTKMKMIKREQYSGTSLYGYPLNSPAGERFLSKTSASVYFFKSIA